MRSRGARYGSWGWVVTLILALARPSVGAAQVTVDAAGAPVVSDTSFSNHLVRFVSGLEGMLNGDATEWLANASHADDVTLLSPYGESFRGWAAVGKRYEFAASRMTPSGATAQVEYLAVEVLGDLAYTVQIEHSVFRIAGEDQSQSGFTRVTQMFRRERGEWKLVHRHMDHVAEATTGP